jgi:hypothetical protein
MFLWYPVLDLARAPRRTARKKGSGSEARASQHEGPGDEVELPLMVGVKIVSNFPPSFYSACVI